MANNKFKVRNGLFSQNLTFADSVENPTNEISLDMLATDKLVVSGDNANLLVVDDAVGYVGIKNDTPLTEFDVTGKIRLSSRLIFGGYTDNTDHGPWIAYNDPTNTFDIVSGFNTTGSEAQRMRFGIANGTTWSTKLTLTLTDFESNIPIVIADAQPRFRLKETDTTDLDKEILVSAGDFFIRNLDDDNAPGTNIVSINSSGDINVVRDVVLADGNQLTMGDGRSEIYGIGPNSFFNAIGSITIQADDDLATGSEFLSLNGGSNSLQVQCGDQDPNKLLYNSNIVWHAGNDGPDSGLNADLLDGFDSSDFTRLSYAYSSNSLSRPVGTGVQWIRIGAFSQNTRHLNVQVISTGDNTQSTDNFVISLASYGFQAHIMRLPGTKYNVPKLLEIRTKFVATSEYELWVKVDQITTSIGSLLVRMNDPGIITTLVAGTEPTVGSMDATLVISATKKDAFSLETTSAISSVGLTSTAAVRATSFIDHDDSTYFLNPATTGTSLAVAGSVGIGTDTPDGNLHVVGTNPKFFVEDTQVGGEWLRFGAGTVGSSLKFSDTGTFVIGPVATKDDTALIETFAITSDGKIGINTNTPSTLLHVKAASGSNILTLGDTAANEHTIIGHYNASSDADIQGLIPGSQFGTIIRGSRSGHVVVALRDNDINDTFAIVSGGGNWSADTTYDKVVASFQSSGTATINGATGINGKLTVNTGTADSDIVELSTGADYQSVVISGNPTPTDGGIDITPKTLPATGTADFVTTFAAASNGSETTRHSVVVDKDVTVGGMLTTTNLTITGTTTTVNTTNLDVTDAVLTLNAGQETPLNDIGLILQRYSPSTTTNYNVGLIWDEDSDRLIFGETAETGADSEITFSSEWMTVTAAGNIGIGESDPQRKLTVRGDSPATLTVAAFYNADTTDSNGSVFSFRGDTTGTGATAFYEYAAVAGEFEVHDHATRSGSLRFFTSDFNGSGDRLIIKGDGKVGIGTADPQSLLHVSGGGITLDGLSEINHLSPGTFPYTLVRASTANSDVTLMRVGEANVGFSTTDTSNYGFSIKYMGTRSGIANSLSIFADNLVAASQIEAFTMIQDGKIGLGVDTPVSPLTIKSNSISSSLSGLTIQANTTTDVIAALGEKGTGGGRLELFDVASGVAEVALYSDGSNNYVVQGNTGFGTTSPNRKVSVNGATSAYIGYEIAETEKWVTGVDGADRFVIYDSVAATNRALIDDATGHFGIGTNTTYARLHAYDPDANIQAAFGFLTAGLTPEIRFYAKDTANTYNSYGAISLDPDNELLILQDPGQSAASLGANPVTINASGNLNVTSTTVSSNTVTGALTVAGGVGIEGTLSVKSVNLDMGGTSYRTYRAASGDTGGAFYLGYIKTDGTDVDGAVSGIAHFAYDYGTTAVDHKVHFEFAQRNGTARGHWWWENDIPEAAADRVSIQLIDVDDLGTDYEVWLVCADFHETTVETVWRQTTPTRSGDLTASTKPAGTVLYDTSNLPTSTLYTNNLGVSGNIIDLTNGNEAIEFLENDLIINGKHLQTDFGLWVRNDQEGSRQVGIDGTPSNLQLYAGGTAHATLTAGGNFGIGVDTPDGKLHVENTTGTETIAYIAQQKTYGVGTGTAERAKLVLSISEAAQTASNRHFVELYTGTTNEGSSADSFFGIATRTSGVVTEKVRILPSGNFGIGELNPQGLLHVSSGTSGDAIVIIEADTDNDNEADNPKLQFRQDANLTSASLYLEGGGGANATGSITNSLILDAKADGNSAIQFATGGKAAGQAGGETLSTVRMTVASDGNIGIGATDPFKDLEIRFNSSDAVPISGNGLAGAAAGSGLLIHNQNATANTYANLDFRSGTADGRIAYVYSGTTNIGNFQFITDNSGTPKVQMVIANAGNIGMGVTSPETSLHIGNGTAATSPTTIRIESGEAATTDPGDFYGKIEFAIDGGENDSGVLPNGVIAEVNAMDFRTGSTSFEDAGIAFFTTDFSSAGTVYRGGFANAGGLHVSSSTTPLDVPAGTVIVTDKVGIGEDTPLAKLHVKDGDAIIENGKLHIASSAAAEGGEGGGGTGVPVITFGESEGTTVTNISMSVGYDGDGYGGNANHVFIGAADAVTNTANRFLNVTFDGRVGVGVVEPGSNFHVNTTATTDVRISTNAANSYTMLKLDNNGASGKEYHFGLGGNTVGTAELQNAVYIWDQDNSAVRWIIDSSGNMSVGSGAASAKLDVQGDIEVNSQYTLNAETATLATTTQTQIASYATADFGGAKIVIQATIAGERHMTELLIVHDGTTASATEYASIYTGAAPLATYDVDISGGNVRVLATSASTASTVYRVAETLMFA